VRSLISDLFAKRLVIASRSSMYMGPVGLLIADLIAASRSTSGKTTSPISYLAVAVVVAPTVLRVDVVVVVVVIESAD